MNLLVAIVAALVHTVGDVTCVSFSCVVVDELSGESCIFVSASSEIVVSIMKCKALGTLRPIFDGKSELHLTPLMPFSGFAIFNLGDVNDSGILMLGISMLVTGVEHSFSSIQLPYLFEDA